MRQVSAVSPTYRRRQHLPGFVEALLRQDGLTELVMAVDGSNDGSVEWLRDRAAADARIVVLDLVNGGAGAARQAGIEAASCDVVVLLDDDVIPGPGLIAGHARHHEDLAPRLVAGYMPNDWRAVAPGHRGIAYIYRRAYELHCELWREDPRSILHGLWGGNISMPREHFLAVGIQHLDVVRGQDDREFGLRCLKAGIEPVFDPSLVALHQYERALDAYRRDCRIQGETRRLIHDAHEDLLGDTLVRRPAGAEIADDVGTRLPGPLRRLWPLLARDPLFAPVAAAVAALHGAGVRAGHLGLETFAAQGLGSLETMRGVLDATKAASSGRGMPSGTRSSSSGTAAASAAQASSSAASSGGSAT
jgi:GT2 family glycosyltransferase